MAMERSIDVNMFDREDWTMKDGSFVVIGCGLDIGLWADCFLYEPLVIGLSWAKSSYCFLPLLVKLATVVSIGFSRGSRSCST